MKTDYTYPENYKDAVKVWQHDGMQFSILRAHLGHYCGYVRFEARPVAEEGYRGFMNYVPVHGGITFANEDDDGSMVYGFDCAHCDDEKDEKLRDLEWLGEECFRMGRAIVAAKEFEPRYLAATDDAEKAKVIQEYHDAMKQQGIDFNLRDNFGAMINAMFGSL